MEINKTALEEIIEQFELCVPGAPMRFYENFEKLKKLADYVAMKSVISSNILQIGYREDDQMLRVKFSNGNTYEYTGVPEELAKQLLTAESVGSFFSKNIRNQWQGKKLEAS